MALSRPARLTAQRIGAFRAARLLQLFYIGPKVLREVANGLSAPDSFEDYMYRHQSDLVDSKIKLTKEEIDLVVKRDVDKMDITLLIKMIIRLFEGNLKQNQPGILKSISNLRALRNKFVHSGLINLAKISTHDFTQTWEENEKELLRLSKMMGVKVYAKTLELIVEARSSSLNFDAIKEMLKEWLQSNPNQKQSLQNIGQLFDELQVESEVNRIAELDYGLIIPPMTVSRLKELFRLYVEPLFRTKPLSYLSLERDSLDIKVDCLKRSNVVVIEGEESTGKTYEAFAVAHQLIKDGSIKLSKCAQLRNPSDVRGVCPTDVDLLLIDGIGNNPNMMQLWEKRLQYLEKVIENHDVKVILTTRVPINLEFTTIRGRFKLASKVFKMWNPLEPWPHALW